MFNLNLDMIGGLICTIYLVTQELGVKVVGAMILELHYFVYMTLCGVFIFSISLGMFIVGQIFIYILWGMGK